jgi:hypothetical protein
VELGFLRRLYDEPGPWVSVYLDATRRTEDAAQAINLRWRGVRADLAQRAVDEATLAAVDRAVERPPRDGAHGYVLFATRGRLAMTARTPTPPARDTGHVGPLPHVVPLLAALGEPVPWVRVVVDRTGADILAAPGWRPAQAIEVVGDEQWPLRRVDAGGWLQPRFQRSAIVSWDRNAAKVAEAVVAAAERVNAETLVVAGDPYARTLLLENLPVRWASIALQIEGSRAPGAKPDHVDAATAEAVQAAAERRREIELDNFSARRASGRARSGLDGVVDAARKGEIATLLLPTTGIGTPLWIGEAPTEVASDPGDLRLGDGTPEPLAVAGDTALVRAVAATDGTLMFTEPGELPDDVGAVLRYPA